ncbi:DNA-deoxyinosine glycosylase [Methylomonas sp. SURF-1]|uniref:DNA-deoxyinosine glycosylase n=1 Tax=Methylomonas aurea TaxID=2952224 RepID=A0ABT1UKV7_9GAMM|nr:DNA-deoxyinosine glycosylase [Methylomonas sp. SURF-1]MCQ8182061.1 DNA-deoxyinosine glycosylase [Methylomonas sp. SURF-1]
MAAVIGFPPIATERASVLILGSMPGIASLAAGEYYAHPRNQFWPIICALLQIDRLSSYDDRRNALNIYGIAVWDVIQACTRDGSLDSAIDKNSVVPNDFHSFFDQHQSIRRVFFNGATAEKLFHRHYPTNSLDGRGDVRFYTRLPSTSPAHAALSLEQKLAAWKAVTNATGVNPKLSKFE